MNHECVFVITTWVSNPFSIRELVERGNESFSPIGGDFLTFCTECGLVYVVDSYA